MRDRAINIVASKIRSRQQNIGYGFWVVVAGIVIGAVCDICQSSYLVLIGQLGGLVVVLSGVLLMVDGLMTVIWEKKGKALWDI